ncbi:hypothetical protein DFH08DRAFT_825350 [Mycena albidolilacea]|uniref:Uncharacterized protein n=1 Tax=Mycena albidolilacea TaxID=1033008 RepID=A0AAD6Z318_9AGAR|nr:hypothetical protein DFH08DRAFT_825350 [Mycena albidolilacea]
MSWCQFIDHTAAFWTSHEFTPTQGRAAFRFMSAKLSGTALHIRLVLRDPTAYEPCTRDDEVGLHAVIELLRSKSEQCATLGIYFNLVLRDPTAYEPCTRDDEVGLHAVIELLRSKSEQCATLGTVFAVVADKLASSSFTHLTQLALINIEPVWTTDRPEKLQPTPEFLKLGEPAMRHLRLVGFSLPLRNNGSFRHIAVLVLGDLDRSTAPTMDELYLVLLEATVLEALSVGKLDRTDPLSDREPLQLNRLNKIHFYAGGNKAFEQLLRLIRAPSLNRLDVRVMDEKDCCSLLRCAELVRPVKTLRLYGVWRADVDFVALSTIMPAVTALDVTTADRALARCAEMAAFAWTTVESLRLRNPKFDSLKSILTFVTVANLHIHYPYPARLLSCNGNQWVSTKVDHMVIVVEGEEAWYTTAH